MFQSLPSSEEIREILVQRIDRYKQAVGIVVGVIDGNGRRVAAYGKAGSGDGLPLDGDTIFEIGSITKVFTSLVLADMVSRNEVALDDPAARYLPENVRMPERSGRSITLHDLSTHCSGLPPSLGQPYAAGFSVDDLYEFLSGYTLPRDPGSAYEYSNLGAGLLGHLLAYCDGTDYESLLRTRITRPLGMADTGITLSVSTEQRMATGHNGMLAPVAQLELSTLAGAGALRSSANDMLTLLEAFLGYKETPLAGAMKSMLTVRRPAGQIEIGLGWFISSTDGREIAGHEGATGGFCSFAGYDPKERVGVVVLANSVRHGAGDIGLHLLNPKVRLVPPEPLQQHCEIPIEPQLLEGYIGRYQVTPNLVLEITREGDRLFTQGFAQLNGQAVALPKFEMFSESENRFFAKVADNKITFQPGPGGRASSLVLHKAGRDMTAPRIL
jgi:serine-type D-Ala-D-Ala carboxypeptidase/endopeptidase